MHTHSLTHKQIYTYGECLQMQVYMCMCLSTQTLTYSKIYLRFTCKISKDFYKTNQPILRENEKKMSLQVRLC